MKKVILLSLLGGYRFADNGVFYVTKTFAVEGKEKTFFAEYLLQGGVSLFRYEEAGLTAEYRWSTSLNKEVDISRLGISAEFGL